MVLILVWDIQPQFYALWLLCINLRNDENDDAVFIGSHVTDLLPIKLISCKMFPQLFLFSNIYFFSLFLRYGAVLKFKMSSYFYLKWYIYSVKAFYMFSVFMRFSNHCIHFYVAQLSNFFGSGVVCEWEGNVFKSANSNRCVGEVQGETDMQFNV